MTSPTGRWAEGDPLSPTNLNSRSPAGNFPSRTYHVAWATGSGTTQINNAITNALAGGYSYLFFDKSRLPYNATAISFNNSLLHVREGQGNWDEVDVRAYGAAGNGSQDDYPAIQAALDFACRTSPATGRIAVLRFPSGQYPLSQPLWYSDVQPIFMVGAGTGWGTNYGTLNATVLYPTYFGGPILFPSSVATNPQFVTSLVTGNGNALYQKGDTGSWFNLRDLKTLDLNGLSAITIELFYKSTISGGGGGMMIGSGGRLCASDTFTTAFALGNSNFGGFPADDKPSGWITTSGTGKVSCVGGTGINDQAVHHLELSYDGSTVRLFAGGTLVDSHAATGTVSQGWIEDVLIGSYSGTIEAGALENTAPGYLDSIRISNIARHTTNFTAPTAKLNNDANTLCLLNFDLNRGLMTRAQTKNGDGWLWYRYSQFGGVGNWHIQGITFAASQSFGPHAIALPRGAVNWQVDRCQFINLRGGIWCPGNGDGYGWRITDLFFNSGAANGASRFALHFNPFAGLGVLDGIWLQGDFLIPLVIQAGSVTIRGFYLLAGNSQQLSQVALVGQISGTIKLEGGALSIEGSSPTTSVWRGNIILDRNGSNHALIDIRGVLTENYNNKPHVVCDSPYNVSFSRHHFDHIGGNPSSVIQVLGTPTTPIEIQKCTQSTWVPWSDVTGAVEVAPLGTCFSSSTGSTLQFDAAIYGRWDVTLSSDVTKSSWLSVSYGQPVSGAIKMDSTGSRLFTWPTNSKGTATLSYGSAAVNTFTGFYDGVNVILTSVRTGL